MKSLLSGSRHLALTLSIALFLFFSTALRGEEICSVKMSIGTEPDMNFHPSNLRYNHTRLIAKNAYLSLFELGREGNAIPVFAKSWDVDAKEKRVRIKLNTSCRWSNGEGISAQQMVDGIRLLYKIGGHIHGLDAIQGAEEVLSGKKPASELGVRALSKDELEIAYVTNFDILRYALTNVIYTPLYANLSDVDLDNMPGELPTVGSGAYVVKEQNEERIVLKRNPEFCVGLSGNIKEVTYYRNIPPKAEVGAFEKGIIDVLPERYFRSYLSLQERLEKGGNMKVTSMNSVRQSIHLFLNQNTEALTSESVKRAIRLVVDHDFLTSNTVFGGVYHQLDGYTPQYPGYTPTRFLWDKNTSYGQRQEEAKKLMESEGYSERNRLILVLPSQGNAPYNTAVYALASMLKKIHIEPSIKTYDEIGAYYGALRSGDYDVGFSIWGDIYPDPSQLLQSILALTTAPSSIEKPLEEKLERSFTIPDRQKRFAVLNEIEQSFKKVGNVLPLYFKTPAFIGKKHLSLGGAEMGYVRGFHSNKCL